MIQEFIMASLLPLVIAFAVSALMGPKFIPFLHKLKFGQEIREEGPKWHQKKSGTPTMGGIMFIIGIAAAVVVQYIIAYANGNGGPAALKGILMLLVALGFGVIGFIDDFIKVVKKRNLGLTSLQKLLMQLALAVIYVLVLYKMGELETIIRIPFTSFHA